MTEKFVSLASISIFLLSMMFGMQHATPVSAIRGAVVRPGVGEINEPIYSTIAEYYDNRTAVVTLTADDWYEGTGQAFEDMCSMLTAKRIYYTCGIITDWNPDWTRVQNWLDQGYAEAASHSRTHTHTPYKNYDSEIGGSKDDIIDNLSLPPIFSFNENEYVYTWIEPYAQSDDMVWQKLAYYKYLVARDTSLDDGWAAWNSTGGLFNRIGYSIRMGSDGTEDTATLNNKFDSVYNMGGIYHLMCHPVKVDWRTNRYADSHTDYIKGKPDVWYVNFGILYLYHWIVTRDVVQISSTGQGQNKVFKISISSIDHQNYGARYPITYIFDVPSGWNNGYVYYRYRDSDPWLLIENKSSKDFFNGINASRFDFANNKAYVSVGFGDVSDDIYLQIRSNPIIHDIAITSVTASPTDVKVGQSVSISVTVENEGNVGETINVSVYYDMELIKTLSGVFLDAGAVTTLNYAWDTIGVSQGTYTLKAVASVASGEEDLADNTYIDGRVKIGSSLPSRGGGGGRDGGGGEDGGNEKPRADFIYSPSEPTDLDTVQFTDESHDPDGSITSWLWDFGDGSTTTEKNPTHKYGDDGNYNVTLTVCDDDNARDDITKQIVILNVSPKADFTIDSPLKLAFQSGIQFTDRSSDSDGLIVSWLWDFGDGTTSTDQNPTHKYENPATYTINLTVMDDDGATAEASKIDDACPPTTIDDYDVSWHTEDFTVTLTATDDYSGVENTYYRFDGDSIRSVQTEGQPHIAMEGLNELEYWSVDAAGNEGTHYIIDVKLDKTIPIVDVKGDRSVNQNTVASFDAGGSSDNVGIVSYEWDFGDGSTEIGVKKTHTYVKLGTYVVTLTVRDAAGNTNTSSISVLVLKDTDGDGTPDTTDKDDDGDGMLDVWEIDCGLDPLNASDAPLDPDGDGLTSLREYQGGSDPYNYFSPLPLRIVVVAAAALVIIIIVSILWKKVR